MFFQKELPCFESFARGFPLMEGDEKTFFSTEHGRFQDLPAGMGVYPPATKDDL
jgi:hypothetical protein